MSIEKEEIVILRKSIRRWQWAVLAYVIFTFSMYLGWFAVNGASLSQQSSNWGTAGDFVGGFLNPVVALAAFFWLTKAVLLQKEELVQSKEALQIAADAQSKQVEISALSALIEIEARSLTELKDKIEKERERLAHYRENRDLDTVIRDALSNQSSKTINREQALEKNIDNYSEKYIQKLELYQRYSRRLEELAGIQQFDHAN